MTTNCSGRWVMRAFSGLLVLVLSMLPFASPADTTPAPKDATLEKAVIESANKEAKAENDIIAQVQQAQAANDWAKAEAGLKELTTMNPDRWDFAQHLGDVQYNQKKYAEAAKSYATAIAGAANDTSDPKAAKQAMGEMYANQGDAYLHLKRNDEAAAALEKGAPLSADPGTAYFNVCALMYKAEDDQAALGACDKAIAASPNMAEAYYLKGDIQVHEGETDAKGNFVVPAGTVEALKTYLKLAPSGVHASEVKQMLDLIGSP